MFNGLSLFNSSSQVGFTLNLPPNFTKASRIWVSYTTQIWNLRRFLWDGSHHPARSFDVLVVVIFLWSNWDLSVIMIQNENYAIGPMPKYGGWKKIPKSSISRWFSVIFASSYWGTPSMASWKPPWLGRTPQVFPPTSSPMSQLVELHEISW